MFQIENKKLEKLIRNSESLKILLSKEQIEKFVEKALSLPKQGQEELEIKLEKEVEDGKVDFEILKKFNENLKDKLKTFRKKTFKKTEIESEKDKDKKINNLLNQI